MPRNRFMMHSETCSKYQTAGVHFSWCHPLPLMHLNILLKHRNWFIGNFSICNWEFIRSQQQNVQYCLLRVQTENVEMVSLCRNVWFKKVLTPTQMHISVSHRILKVLFNLSNAPRCFDKNVFANNQTGNCNPTAGNFHQTAANHWLGVRRFWLKWQVILIRQQLILIKQAVN